jgi:hypothetical protein
LPASPWADYAFTLRRDVFTCEFTKRRVRPCKRRTTRRRAKGLRGNPSSFSKPVARQVRNISKASCGRPFRATQIQAAEPLSSVLSNSKGAQRVAQVHCHLPGSIHLLRSAARRLRKFHRRAVGALSGFRCLKFSRQALRIGHFWPRVCASRSRSCTGTYPARSVSKAQPAGVQNVRRDLHSRTKPARSL